jgi:hypothetical protein
MGLAVGISSWDWLLELAAGDGNRIERLNRQIGLPVDTWEWQIGLTACLEYGWKRQLDSTAGRGSWYFIWTGSWAAGANSDESAMSVDFTSSPSLPYLSPLSHPPPPPLPVFHVSIALGEGPGACHSLSKCVYIHAYSQYVYMKDGDVGGN